MLRKNLFPLLKADLLIGFLKGLYSVLVHFALMPLSIINSWIKCQLRIQPFINNYHTIDLLPLASLLWRLIDPIKIILVSFLLGHP